MGSISGLTATTPGGIMYSASKFAMEGLTEGLAMQLEPFNIRVLLVEPSFFRTNWLVGGYVTPQKEMTKDYLGSTIDSFLKAYPARHGKQPGDPVKAARLIIDVATEVGVGADKDVKKCLRLPLGNDAIEFGRKYFEKLTHDFDTMESIARSADYDQE
jgi:NAD(P)-dependent dehydrogenase (short-subunit alcohol dehydrogenase family)